MYKKKLTNYWQIIKKAYYQTKVSFRPTDANSCYRLGQIFTYQNELSQAVKYYRLAIEYNHAQTAHIYCLLGRILVKLHKFQEAAEVCHKSISLDSNNFKAHFHLGEALIRQKKFPEAIANFQQARELNPQFSWSYFHLGHGYLKLRQFPEAIANFQIAIKLNSQDNLSKLGLKQAITSQQREKSIQHLQHQIDSNPENSGLLFELGLALFQQERWQEAAIYLSQYITLVPNNRYSYGILAQTLKKLDRQLNYEKTTPKTVSKLKSLTQQLVDATHPHFTPQIISQPILQKPQYLIIGQQKCGTTSLYHYLVQHDQILPALKKEIDFWSDNYHQGYDWYSAHFSDITPEQNFITGEASPSYFNCPWIAKQILKQNPRIKIIILLRNPVDRTISHYHMEYRDSRENRSLEDAVISEVNSTPRQKHGACVDFVNSTPRQKHGACVDFVNLIQDSSEINRQKNKLNQYLVRSQYIDLLRPWVESYSASQLLILKSEDLFTNPKATVNQVFDFLGVESFQLAEYKKINYGSYTNISLSNVEILKDYFRPYNQQLEKFLDRKFDWYK